MFPGWSAPEGYGNSWIRNDDHSISVLPGWVVGAPPGFDDGAAINAAYARLPAMVTTGAQTGPNSATVGTVRLGPYQYNLYTGVVKPACANLVGQGPGTILAPQVPGLTALFTHSLVHPGQQFGNPAIFTMGKTEDVTIDGTLAGANAIGLDIGDGWGHTTRNLAIKNFAGTNSLGMYFVNRQFWCEKFTMDHLTLSNNTTAAIFDTLLTTPEDISQEYNLLDVSLFAQAGQQGLVLTSSVGTGVNWGGFKLHYRGNMSSQSSLAIAESLAFLTLLNGARLYQTVFEGKIEGNNGGGTPGGSNYPYFISSDGNSYVKQCGGHIAHSLGNATANSNLNGAEFGFGGKIAGDPDLAQAFPTAGGGTSGSQPGVPATTVPFNNTGPDFSVTVTAGAGGSCAVAVNNSGTVTLPASELSNFYVNSGGTIKLTYAGGATPSWVWQSAAQMSN